VGSGWLPVLTSLIGLVGVVVGYWSAGLNDARRDRRAHEREREARASDANSAREARRHEFQLETLLELEDALQLMTRLTGRAVHFDHMQARRGQYTQLPEQWSEEMHNNGVDVRRLTARVLEDDVRDAVPRFTKVCAEVSVSPRCVGQ